MSNLNLNSVMLGGRITKDIELKTTSNGKSVCSFTLAVNRHFKGESGNTEADFFNCTAFSKTAETISQYFKKGSCILIMGELQNRTWQGNDGTKHYSTDVMVEKFFFVDSKSDATPTMTELPADADLPF